MISREPSRQNASQDRNTFLLTEFKTAVFRLRNIGIVGVSVVAYVILSEYKKEELSVIFLTVSLIISITYFYLFEKSEDTSSSNEQSENPGEITKLPNNSSTDNNSNSLLELYPVNSENPQKIQKISQLEGIRMETSNQNEYILNINREIKEANSQLEILKKQTTDLTSEKKQIQHQIKNISDRKINLINDLSLLKKQLQEVQSSAKLENREIIAIKAFELFQLLEEDEADKMFKSEKEEK